MLSHINVGCGSDISIFDLAGLSPGYRLQGQILTDPSKPDGTARKLLDCSRLTRLGWKASVGLEDGIRYSRWFW